MGVFDLFKPKPSVPNIISILPDAAKQEIVRGRLPILNTNKIFLKPGEKCHYVDKAIYEKRIAKKRYVHRGNSYSVPGFFKGTRINMGGGHTDVIDNEHYENFRGILYITNKRIIFVTEENGFNKKIDELVALTPYANCIMLQFSKENYKLFVPDGNLAYKVLQLNR